MKFVLVTQLSISLLLLSCGCNGGDSIERSSVSGKVTYGGEPVETGFIHFIPVLGVEGAPVKLTIKNGEYNSSSDPLDDRGVAIGESRVEIVARKKTGKEIKNEMGEMEEENLQYIPEKFNLNSELKADVQPGANTFDFELNP